MEKRPVDEGTKGDHPRRQANISPRGVFSRRPDMPGGDIGAEAAYDIKVDVTALARHFVDDRPKEPLTPAGPGRFPENNFGDIMGTGVAEDFLDDICAA